MPMTRGFLLPGHRSPWAAPLPLQTQATWIPFSSATPLRHGLLRGRASLFH